MTASLEKLLRLRVQERACGTCRYYRECLTGSWSSECLLIGRTLAIGDLEFIRSKQYDRVCDGWKRQPKKWDIRCEGVDANPYWHDKYITRETQERLRRRLL